MSTEARITANRENSLKSTGPKTPDGKAKVSRNAVKHGFTSNEIVVAEEERENFEYLRDSLIVSVCPANTPEQLVFSQLLYAAWNLERIRIREGNCLLTGLDALSDPATAKELELLHRYSVRFERSYHRNMNELKKLQTSRAITERWTAKTGEKPPLLVDVANVTKQSQQFDNGEFYDHVFQETPAEADELYTQMLAEARANEQALKEMAALDDFEDKDDDPDGMKLLRALVERNR